MQIWYHYFDFSFVKIREYLISYQIKHQIGIEYWYYERF